LLALVHWTKANQTKASGESKIDIVKSRSTDLSFNWGINAIEFVRNSQPFTQMGP